MTNKEYIIRSVMHLLKNRENRITLAYKVAAKMRIELMAALLNDANEENAQNTINENNKLYYDAVYISPEKLESIYALLESDVRATFI